MKNFKSFGVTEKHLVIGGTLIFLWGILFLVQDRANTDVIRKCSLLTHKIVEVESPLKQQLICVRRVKDPAHTNNVLKNYGLNF